MVSTVNQCRIKKNVQRLVSDPGFIFADFIVSTATLHLNFHYTVKMMSL